MKKIIFISLFVLAFYSTAISQNNSSCPKVEFISPTSAITVGDVMEFKISLSNEIKDMNLEYKWTVSARQIFKGQGTTSIKVDTNTLTEWQKKEGQKIIGIVEIKGLPDNCAKNFSEFGILYPIIGCGSFPVEYEKISLKEEFERFDILFTELANNPSARGFVLMEISKKEEILDAKSHIQKIIRFIEWRGYDKSKLIFAIKKADTHRTEHIIVSKGVNLPECENCEIIKGSDINLKKPQKKAKRRKN